MPTLILATHILCVALLAGISVGIGVVLPRAITESTPPAERLRILTLVLDQARGPVLGAVAGIFITGFFNIASLQSGVGILLLIKMGIAVLVAMHALGLVNGVAGKLRAVESDGEGLEPVLLRAERLCERFALSQLALVAIITVLSLNL